MKALREWPRNKLFQSIARMVLLVLIPTVALGGYTYWQTSQTAWRNAEQTVMRQLTYAVRAVDKRLENLISLYAILASDREFQTLEMKTVSTAADTARMLNTMTMLNHIISANDCVKEAFIDNGNGKIVSSGGIFSSEYYLMDYRRLEGFTMERWAELRKECRTLTFLPSTTLVEKQEQRYSRRSVVPVAKRLHTTAGTALVVCLLDTQNLLDHVRQYIPFGNALCTITSPQEVIAADPVSQARDDVPFTYISSQNGWVYRVDIPRGELTSMTDPLLLQVLLTVAAILALGMVLAVTISRSLYQPLSGIQTMMKAQEQSAAENLEQLEKQVARQIEHSSSAHAQLNTLAQSYAEEALLSQSLTEKEAALLETIMTRHLGFHEGPYCCVVIRFARTVAGMEELTRNVFAKFVPAFIVSYQEPTLILIVETATVHTRSIMEGAANELFRRLPEAVNGVVVGSEIVSCQELYKSLNASLTALQRMDRVEYNILLFSEDFNISNQYVYTQKDELTLIETLQRGETDRLHRQLDRILLTNYESCVSYQQMQQLFEHLRSTAYRYAQQEKRQIPPHIYRRMPSLDTMREEIHSLYGKLLNHGTRQASSAHVALTEAADAYMAAHYSEDIYMDTIAQALNVSAKHLSKVYKQQRCINLTDQLVFIRVERAKELLRDTDRTITDIMSRTGFVSRATFLRSFKKYTDISPSVYRHLYNADAPHEPDEAEK